MKIQFPLTYWYCLSEPRHLSLQGKSWWWVKCKTCEEQVCSNLMLLLTKCTHRPLMQACWKMLCVSATYLQVSESASGSIYFKGLVCLGWEKIYQPLNIKLILTSSLMEFIFQPNSLVWRNDGCQNSTWRCRRDTKMLFQVQDSLCSCILTLCYPSDFKILKLHEALY